MRNNLKGSLRIGNVSDSYGDGYVSVEIEDHLSGIDFLNIKLSYEQFGKLIAGNGSVNIECETFGLDNIGKVRETKAHSVVLTKDQFEDIVKGASYPSRNSALSAYLKEHHQQEGWQLDTYLGSRNSIVEDYSSNTVALNISLIRYVGAVQ